MIKESDIVIKEEPLGFGEIFITGSITYSAEVKTHKRYRTRLDKQIKRALVHQLNHEIWGRKNEELRNYIIENEYRLVSMSPADYRGYKEISEFFKTLLEKVSGP